NQESRLPPGSDFRRWVWITIAPFVTKEEARVKRENEFIDQELKHKAAQTDVVQSEADANRNMTEGGRDLMKSVGKAEENKSDSWFN
ncbi:DUF5384 family protein, partial [Escherichia coli]|uniref:DUF5384 family protein n=1 Tax=Escherichia coli TaxID=562 RepID=UPI001FCE9DEA